MITFHARTKYLDQPVICKFGIFEDGITPAIWFEDAGGKLVNATVSLLYYKYLPPDWHVIVNDDGPGEGMLDCLMQNGVVGPPIEVMTIGLSALPICPLTRLGITELDKAVRILRASMVPAGPGDAIN